MNRTARISTDQVPNRHTPSATDTEAATLRRENARLVEQVDTLQERIRQMEEEFTGSNWTPPECLFLSRQEARVLQTLYRRTSVTTDQLMMALYGGQDRDWPDSRIISVRICHLRTKLRAYGIEIVTQYRQGYWIGKTARERLDSLKNDRDHADFAALKKKWTGPIDQQFTDRELSAICDALAKVVGITTKQLLSPTRQRKPIADARGLAAYLMCRELGLSAAGAGRVIGRNHTSITTAISKIEATKEDETTAKMLDGMAANLMTALRRKQNVFSLRTRTWLNLDGTE